MNKNQVLKQRSITGILFGLSVILLLLSGKTGAIVLAGFIAGFSCYEYVRMIFPKNKKKLVLSLSLTFFVIILFSAIPPLSILFLGAIIVSCVLLLLGILHMFVPFINHRKYYWLVTIGYFGMPMGSFIAFVLHQPNYYGGFWIAVLSTIWMSDSFAYLIGSRIGKTKLFERISPKKTWEGFIGAGLCTLPLAYVAGEYFLNTPPDLFDPETAGLSTGLFLLLVACFAWIMGTLGDLVESSIKRTFNIKDSGKLLPGHGGILDRFDSFIYIVPFVLFLLQIFRN